MTKCCGKCMKTDLHEIPVDYVDEDEIHEIELDEDDLKELFQNPEIFEKSDHQKIGEILGECKALLLKKGLEYNNGKVKMGDYFPRGILSVSDTMHAKLLKIYSLLSADIVDVREVEETAKDLINYTAIFIGVSRGLIETPATKK